MTQTLRELVEAAKREVVGGAGSCRTFGLIEGNTYHIVGVEHDRGDLFLKMEPVDPPEEMSDAGS